MLKSIIYIVSLNPRHTHGLHGNEANTVMCLALLCPTVPPHVGRWCALFGNFITSEDISNTSMSSVYYTVHKFQVTPHCQQENLITGNVLSDTEAIISQPPTIRSLYWGQWALLGLGWGHGDRAIYWYQTSILQWRHTVLWYNCGTKWLWGVRETVGKAEGTEPPCFLWGTHRSHFLQCQCYCQFWKLSNPVYIQISNFFTGQTDWDGQNRLLNSFTHARAR